MLYLGTVPAASLADRTVKNRRIANQKAMDPFSLNKCRYAKSRPVDRVVLTSFDVFREPIPANGVTHVIPAFCSKLSTSPEKLKAPDVVFSQFEISPCMSCDVFSSIVILDKRSCTLAPTGSDASLYGKLASDESLPADLWAEAEVR